MDFKNEVKSFVNNHPTISRLSLGTIPVIWVAAGKLVSSIGALTGITQKTAEVAQQNFEDYIQIGITLWHPTNVRTDSNNLYSAFAQIFENDANKYKEVRKKVVDIEAHIFDESIDTGPLNKPSQEFMNYVLERTKNSDSKHSGEAEIVALTIAYPVTIHVHKRDSNGKIEPTSTTYGSGEMNVHLLQDGATYKPLIPL